MRDTQGKAIASGAAGEPRLIRFQPWELVTATAWSPDGELLGIAAGNHVYIYSASDLTRIASLEIPTGALTPALKFHPDGNYLASGSGDGYIRVWKAAELGQIQHLGEVGNHASEWEINAHRKGVNSLDYSPDGSRLASSGNDGMVRLWELFQNKPVIEIIGGAYAIPSIDFSPDGARLAIISSNILRLRESNSGRISGSLISQKPLFCVAYSPDGSILVTGDQENTLQIWDASQVISNGYDPIPDPVALMGHNGKSGSSSALVWQAAFSPDGKWLASAGGDRTIRIWNLDKKTLAQILLGHTAPVTSIAFSPDGMQIISGSLDGSARIWDLREIVEP